MQSARGSNVRLWVATLSVALACLLAAGSAGAGIPTEPNANLADATQFNTQTFADTGNVAGANEEANENDHAGVTAFQGSLWWKWTAPSSQRVRVETCNLTQFDSVIAVYNDPAGPDTFPLGAEVASNDDGCGGPNEQSRLTFTPVAGEKYLITVTTKEPSGPLTFEWQLKPTPGNDDVANATVLGTTPPITVNGDSSGATEEPNENDHANPGDPSPMGGASVWYSWSPAADAEVTVDTCSAGLTFPINDSVLAVYENDTPLPVTEVASDNNSCGLQSMLTFDAEDGETYLIAVDGSEEFPGEESQEGAFTLNINARPPNDDFANAQTIPGAIPQLNTSGSTLGATAETPDEPGHGAGGPFRSVWYSWTPTVGGGVTIDVCGSSFDGRLGVYTGTTLANLADVNPTEDGCASADSFGQATFNAVSGQQYWIAVDNETLDGGTVDLDIEETDVTDPVATIDAIKVNKPRGKAKFTFSATDNKTPPANLDFTCRLDNKPEAACTSPITYKKQKRGKHTFRVFATDEAGNDSTVLEETFRSSRR